MFPFSATCSHAFLKLIDVDGDRFHVCVTLRSGTAVRFRFTYPIWCRYVARMLPLTSQRFRVSRLMLNVIPPFVLQLPSMFSGRVILPPDVSLYVTTLPMALLVVCSDAFVLKLQCRCCRGTICPRLSSTSAGLRCIWKFVCMLVVNEGFSPGFPIDMFSGLVSSYMSNSCVMLGCCDCPRSCTCRFVCWLKR